MVPHVMIDVSRLAITNAMAIALRLNVRNTGRARLIRTRLIQSST